MNDDLISRQAAIDWIRECAEAARDNWEWEREQGYLNSIECIEEQQTIDAVPIVFYCTSVRRNISTYFKRV